MKIVPFMVLLPALILTACNRTSVPDLPETEASVRSIAELAAAEQIYRDVVYIGEKQQFLVFTIVDRELLFSIDIRVQAGIRNMDKLRVVSVSSISGGGFKAVIEIPQSEILLIDADESSIKQFFLKEKGKGISRLEYYNEIEAGKEAIKTRAVDSGLISRADSNAEKLISDLLRLSGISKVEFRRLKDG